MFVFGNSGGEGGPLTIGHSVRLRAAATASLSRGYDNTLQDTDNKVKTYSMWVKRARTGVTEILYSHAFASNNLHHIYFGADDTLQVYAVYSGTATLHKRTSRVFRDTNAWMHIVLAVDMQRALADDRVVLYINNQRVTSYDINTVPAQGTFGFSFMAPAAGTWTSRIGYNTASTYPFDGLVAEFNIVDGQYLTAESFGMRDLNNNWVPRTYLGPWGNNGVRLSFSYGSTVANLGINSAPNNQPYAVNNVSVTPGVTYDWLTDTPTNNFAVLNSLNSGAAAVSGTLYAGNLSMQTASNGTGWSAYSSIAANSGKFYFEGIAQSNGGYGSFNMVIASASTLAGLHNSLLLGNQAGGLGFGTGGIAVDVDTGKVWFRGTNGNWLNGNPETGENPSHTFAADGDVVAAFYVSRTSGNATAGYGHVNFGQRPFAYTPPTGFKSLCTANLSEVSIPDPSLHFQALPYLGNGVDSLSLNNIKTKFLAGLINIKNRAQGPNNTWSHYVADKVRGFNSNGSAYICTNETSAETGLGSGYGVTTVDESGFNVKSNGTLTNTNGDPYIAWVWNAGEEDNVANTDGSISSIISANPLAGFSIVSYNGSGVAGATVGHGLGTEPDFIIAKNLTNAGYNWLVYHSFSGLNPRLNYLALQTDEARVTNSVAWNDTGPTSSVFTIGSANSVNTNGSRHIAYVYSRRAGFSDFGTYNGNGLVNGRFIYCGFRPAYVLIKSVTAVGEWVIHDTGRLLTNLSNLALFSNRSYGETAQGSSNSPIDILCNGFKLRGTGASTNTSGQSYIYAAFAENPFGGSNVSPSLAH